MPYSRLVYVLYARCWLVGRKPFFFLSWIFFSFTLEFFFFLHSFLFFLKHPHLCVCLHILISRFHGQKHWWVPYTVGISANSSLTRKFIYPTGRQPNYLSRCFCVFSCMSKPINLKPYGVYIFSEILFFIV